MPASPPVSGRARLRRELAQPAGHVLLAGALPQLRSGRPELLQRDPIADRRAAGPAHPPIHPPMTRPSRYGGEATFPSRTSPLYSRGGTRIEIEFSRSADLRPRGTFADPERVVRPTPVGEGVYRYRLRETFTQTPGTYYWIVERFDGFAEPDGYVTDGEIRSFTVNLRWHACAEHRRSPAIRRVEPVSAGPGSSSRPTIPARPSSATTPAAGHGACRRRGSGA